MTTTPTRSLVTAFAAARRYGVGLEHDTDSPALVTTRALPWDRAEELASDLRTKGFGEVSTARDNADPGLGWVYVTISTKEDRRG